MNTYLTFRTNKAAQHAGYNYLNALATNIAKRCVEYSSRGRRELVITCKNNEQFDEFIDLLWQHEFKEKWVKYDHKDLSIVVKPPKGW